MVRIALLLAILADGCMTDGNTLTGRWNATNCDDGFLGTGVTVAVAGNDGNWIAEHARCDDGGFAITVPTSMTSATITATDGAGSTWSSDVTISANVDLGTIYFDRGTQPD